MGKRFAMAALCYSAAAMVRASEVSSYKLGKLKRRRLRVRVQVSSHLNEWHDCPDCVESLSILDAYGRDFTDYKQRRLLVAISAAYRGRKRDIMIVKTLTEMVRICERGADVKVAIYTFDDWSDIVDGIAGLYLCQRTQQPLRHL